MRLSVLVIVSTIACHIATAHAQEATGPYRAGYLRDACNALALTQGTSSEASGIAMAEGLCGGAISTVMRLGPKMNEQFRFCPPPAATPQQIIPIVVKFIDDNPKALNLDIRDVANYVGRLTWPCR
jgi:hypothetical protein